MSSITVWVGANSGYASELTRKEFAGTARTCCSLATRISAAAMGKAMATATALRSPISGVRDEAKRQGVMWTRAKSFEKS